MAHNERQGASRVKSVVKARERNGQQVMVAPILVRSFIYNHKACQISVECEVNIFRLKKKRQGRV